MVAILFSLAQMQSIHLVRCPRGWGGRGETVPSISTSTRLLSSGVPFTLSGNTTTSIFISREIEIFCLPFPSFASDRVRISSLVRYFSFSFFGSKIEFRKKVQDRRGYEVKIKIISIVEC